MASSTTKGVLRHLRHLMPPPTGAAGKFAMARMPRQAQAQPAFVPPKDRIAFWNIVPGDRVRLRKGKVLGKDDLGRGVKGEGIVSSIDRTRNVVWIRNEENPHLNPTTGLRHSSPRLNDPEEGPEKGFSPNRMEVAKPVHYSNLILRLPDDVQLPEELKKNHDPKAGIFASRIGRSTARYSKMMGMFTWTRYALLRDDEGQTYRVEIPWPKKEGRSRTITSLHSSANVVTMESWLPWNPSDPVHLATERFRTSPHSEARYEALMADRTARGLPGPANANLARAPRLSDVQNSQSIGVPLERSQSPADLSNGFKNLAVGGTSETTTTEHPVPPPVSHSLIRHGTYAGFQLRRSVKPPPIAQAPTAAERLWMRKVIQTDWARNQELRDHAQRGGLSFAPSDYLDLAPAEGPAAGGNWALPDQPSIKDEDGNELDGSTAPLLRTSRDVRDGKLLKTEGGGVSASLMEIDTWPIELLMAKELSNEGGLAKRMGRWKERKEAREEMGSAVKREERRNGEIVREWGERRLEMRRLEEERRRRQEERKAERKARA